MIFDTHAHYTDGQFDEDRDELLSGMSKNNVGLILNACSSLDEMPDILKIAEKYPFVYAAVGIHPEAVLTATDGYLDRIRDFAKHEKVKAIGEIGLAGECRGVSNLELRLKEAARLGFTKAVIPYKSFENKKFDCNIELIPIKGIFEAIKLLKSDDN